MLCHPLRNPSGQIHPIKESNPVSFRGLCRSLQISIFSTHFTQSAAETRFWSPSARRARGLPPRPPAVASPLNRLSCSLAVMMAKEKPPITVVGDVGGRIAIIVVRQSEFSSGWLAGRRVGWLPPSTSPREVLTFDLTFLRSRHLETAVFIFGENKQTNKKKSNQSPLWHHRGSIAIMLGRTIKKDHIFQFGLIWLTPSLVGEWRRHYRCETFSFCICRLFFFASESLNVFCV